MMYISFAFTVQIVLQILQSICVCGSRLENRKYVDDYLDICLKGRNQKEKPGPETNLFAQCLPWKSRSCCTDKISLRVNTERNFLNFNWNHCQDLSLKCRQYFIQDLCFYECSPNVGPWLVEDPRKIRKERFQDVPLCRSECHQWWYACKDDFTCVENWAEHFNWSTGINTCPDGSMCRPFHQVYSGPEHFCENLFGPSFKVVPDSPGECFHFWFDPKFPNPNEIVAKKRAEFLVHGNNGTFLKPFVLLMMFTLFHLLFYI